MKNNILADAWKIFISQGVYHILQKVCKLWINFLNMQIYLFCYQRDQLLFRHFSIPIPIIFFITNLYETAN